MTEGYCTVEDVRRVLQEADLTGALEEDNNQVVIDAISGLRHWIELITHKHWYVPDGIAEDSHDLIPTEPRSRDDEYDIPSHGGFVHGASEERTRRRKNSDALLETGRRDDHRRRRYRRRKTEIRIAIGTADSLKRPVDDSIPAYTRIGFDRKDVQDVTSLNVIDDAGGYVDWVASDEHSGGVGTESRGADWWVRINNRGVSELYLDVHAFDDEIASFSNAVYVDFEYGMAELPNSIRRGVSQLVVAELILDDEAAIGIPDSGQLVNVETKAQRLERQGLQKLKPHLTKPIDAVRVPAV